MYGNPDELDRLAGRIDQHAEAIREQASIMDKPAGVMRWESVAADACRQAIRTDRGTLGAVADQHGQAAARLRRHAQRARERIAEIEHAVTGWFHDPIYRVERAESGIEHALGAPPWRDRPHQPDTCPAYGDKARLVVGDFLRKQGVL